MAQQVEHVLGKDEVPGSNPGISSKRRKHLKGCFLLFVVWARDRTCLKGTVRGGAATKGAKRLLSRYQLQKKKGTRNGVPIRDYKKIN